eukprot:10257373-Ditylum_brightwellii.AAC.1
MNLQYANLAKIPALKAVLGQDKDSILFDGKFNYASVVGIFMYIANNTRPDIPFTMNQCARHTH